LAHFVIGATHTTVHEVMVMKIGMIITMVRRLSNVGKQEKRIACQIKAFEV